MKKIIVLYLLILIAFKGYSQIYTDSVLNIFEDGNQITVGFKLPAMQVIDTNLNEIYGVATNFKYIKINEDFGIIDSVGLPELPQLTFDLQVPNNAYGFRVSIISCRKC